MPNISYLKYLIILGLVLKQIFIDILTKVLSAIHTSIASPSKSSPMKGNLKDSRDLREKFNVLVKRFELETKKPITTIFSSLILTNKNPESGISYYHFEETMNTFGKWTPTERFLLFRVLDLNGNGNIGFEDLVECFMEFKTSDSDYSFFMVNIAKYFQAINLNTKEALFQKGIVPESLLSEEDFAIKLTSVINIFKEDAKKVFQIMLKKGKNSVMGAELINLINSYRTDLDYNKVKLKTTQVKIFSCLSLLLF